MIFASWSWPGWRDWTRSDGWEWLGQFAWGWCVLCMVVILMSASVAVTKRPLGFLINERNLMSLSRFQTVIWTVIVLSAYFVIVVAKMMMGKPKPLEIAIDPQLWALIGISLTSLVGTSLISSTKINKNPADTEVDKTAKALVANNNLPAMETSTEAAAARAAANVKATEASTAAKTAAAKPADAPEAATAATAAAAAKAASAAAAAAAVDDVGNVIKQNNLGTLYANPSITDASFSDMFEGDEVGNAAYIDLAKVQMFFFTIIVALSYVVQLSGTMWDLAIHAETVKELPHLSNGMIALLGVSHAGLLAGKSVDRTKTQP
jgi:hypothetical protein